MELARRFGAMKNRQGRRLVFMTFSGEELGLLGSAYYCREPLFPLDKTIAMFNLDMVGRLPKDSEKLLVEGSTTSKNFNALVEKLNKNYNFVLHKDDKFQPNSDHYSFYAKKIPVLFFWTGYHPDYHKPSDTADKINVPGMRKIVDLSEDVVQYLATVPEHPDYVAGKVSTGRGGNSGPRWGFTPAYGDEGKGVLISEVRDGMPAAKAGLKGGDRILEVAGKPIKDLQGFMDVMSGQKAGNTIESVIKRRRQEDDGENQVGVITWTRHFDCTLFTFRARSAKRKQNGESFLLRQPRHQFLKLHQRFIRMSLRLRQTTLAAEEYWLPLNHDLLDWSH